MSDSIHNLAQRLERLERALGCPPGFLDSWRFIEFLSAKFSEDFKAWIATGGKRTEANAVCPEDIIK